ncbi:MAG: hypothetical protein M3680_26455 [Myxococcota bacterium]|nr:hypothetical protein [Myxococcota bacterium]
MALESYPIAARLLSREETADGFLDVCEEQTRSRRVVEVIRYLHVGQDRVFCVARAIDAPSRTIDRMVDACRSLRVIGATPADLTPRLAAGKEIVVPHKDATLRVRLSVPGGYREGPRGEAHRHVWALPGGPLHAPEVSLEAVHYRVSAAEMEDDRSPGFEMLTREGGPTDFLRIYQRRASQHDDLVVVLRYIEAVTGGGGVMCRAHLRQRRATPTQVAAMTDVCRSVVVTRVQQPAPRAGAH